MYKSVTQRSVTQRSVTALLPLLFAATALHAQAPAAARQLGTVTAVSGSTLTLKPTSGAEVTVNVAPDAPVLQLPPGSTDLKAVTPAKLEDVAVGDRVLASGTKDASDALTATRLVLMKSTDIAARNAGEERDWQRRGLGGLVRSVDAPEITVVSGAKVLKITTTSTTVFKRYAADSVSFADVKPGSIGEVRAGDQLRARGALSDDKLSLTAEEIVSGSFENLSGIVSAVDPSAQSLTLKDSATKKSVTVYVTQKSDLRNLPPEAAARFAARTGGAPGASGVGRTEGTHQAPGAGAPAGGPPAGTGGAPAGANGASAGANGAAPAGARTRSAGMDLSQMLSRLPTQTLADLHPGAAVMIVATRGKEDHPTAVTLLSGVEQILSSTPAGAAPVTLSPWNLGGQPDAGGEGGGR